MRGGKTDHARVSLLCTSHHATYTSCTTRLQSEVYPHRFKYCDDCLMLVLLNTVTPPFYTNSVGLLMVCFY